VGSTRAGGQEKGAGPAVRPTEDHCLHKGADLCSGETDIYSSRTIRYILWSHSLEESSREKGGKVIPLLRTIQNSRLRTVAGAYRATPIRSFQVETYIPPVDIYLNSRVKAFQRRVENSRSSLRGIQLEMRPLRASPNVELRFVKHQNPSPSLRLVSLESLT
jgi:hypothetical protein